MFLKYFLRQSSKIKQISSALFSSHLCGICIALALSLIPFIQKITTIQLVKIKTGTFNRCLETTKNVTFIFISSKIFIFKSWASFQLPQQWAISSVILNIQQPSLKEMQIKSRLPIPHPVLLVLPTEILLKRHQSLTNTLVTRPRILNLLTQA